MVGEPHVIVVEQGDGLTPGVLKARVASRSGATVGHVHYADTVHLRHRERTVVDDDVLPARECLGTHRLDGLDEHGRPAASGGGEDRNHVHQTRGAGRPSAARSRAPPLCTGTITSTSAVVIL